MKKKYEKPTVVEYPVVTVWGQTEGVCVDGVRPGGGGLWQACTAGLAPSSPTNCGGGTDPVATNVCNTGTSPGN